MQGNQVGYSLRGIESRLLSLGVAYEKEGPDNEYDGFCSFRNCRDGGIYYAAGRTSPPQQVKASLFICDTERPDLLEDGNTVIRVTDAQSTFYKLMDIFHRREAKGAIHPTVVVGDGAIIEKGVEIGPYCVIERAVIKSGTRLRSHVAVYDDSVIEAGVVVESFTCIGATGAAWSFDAESGERVVQPQIGGVLIKRNAFIGSNVTIVRGSVSENTEIGENCVIAHGTKIGHGCRIGAYTHFANNVTLGGNVDVGACSFIGSAAVLRPHVSLAEGTIVAAGAVVVKSVFEPDCLLVGVPAEAVKSDKGNLAGVPSSFIRKRKMAHE